MYFTNPIWNSSLQTYKVEFLPTYDFEHIEYHDTSSGNPNNEPDINDNEFSLLIQKIAEQIYTEGSSWFSSPIKPTVFLKRVNHTFLMPRTVNNYGHGTLKYTFTPKILNIKSNKFEIIWDTRFEKVETNDIEFNEDLTLQEPRKTIVIQSHPADLELIEDEAPCEGSVKMELSSRAILKKRVRLARLKSAMATMRAERLAEKYFRRYGISTEFDSESELSDESSEEDSE